MTDIVERILTFEFDCDSPRELNKLLDEAVYELEKLRVALMYYVDKSIYDDTEVKMACGCCSYFIEPRVAGDKGKVARTALGGYDDII